MGNIFMKDSELTSNIYAGCTNTDCSCACTCYGNSHLYKDGCFNPITLRPIYKNDDELLQISNERRIAIFRNMPWIWRLRIYGKI